jgi:lipoyl synthase
MRLPEWIRKDLNIRNGHLSGGSHSTRGLLRRHGLSSVCEEGRCPNSAACFAKPVAAFMILGNVCTRDCAFCAVDSGVPSVVDPSEPERIADAAAEMGLRHVVVTSVTRDDLPDGGASHFAAVIRAIRQRLPNAGVETLIPDFKGDINAIKTVLDAGPDVFNHNMETVRRLYPEIRPAAVYNRSLQVLGLAHEINPAIAVKSGFMLGLGETTEEADDLLTDIRDTGCDTLTIGQYLRPTKKNHPVVEYINPAVFEALGRRAMELGFGFVASAPLVRSSMNAEEMYRKRIQGSVFSNQNKALE